MPGFTSYQTTPEGLVRMQKMDGSWTLGVLPTAAAPFMAGLQPYQAPAPVETAGSVDPGMVAALPPRRGAAGADALAANGDVVMPAATITSEPVGLAKIAVDAGHKLPAGADAPVGLAAIAPTANRVPGQWEQLDQAGQALSDGMQGHGAPPRKPDLVPVTPAAAGGGGAPGRPGYVTPSDAGAGASRERAAKAWEDVAAEQGRPVAGVYDPGGPRMVGYTTQRQNGTSTQALREGDRAAERGIPGAVVDGVKRDMARVDAELAVAIGQLGKAKKPAERDALKAQVEGKLQERARLRQSLAGVLDQGPSDQEALRDLEGRERARGVIDQQGADIDAEHAQGAAEAAAERQDQMQRRATEVQAFHARKTQELGDLYGQLDAKRKQYEAMEVDPNRAWSRAGVGGSLAAGIYVALSGAQQALAGGNHVESALGHINSVLDQDVKLQVEAIGKKGKELGQLAEQYQIAKDRFGSEEAGLAAAHLAALDAAGAKVDRMAADATSEKAKLGAARLKAGLQEQIALRRFQLENAAKGQIAEQVRIDPAGVRGGRGPNLKARAEALDKAGEARGKSADDNRANAENAVKGDGQTHKVPGALYVGGQPLYAHPSASQVTIDAAQKQVGYGERGLETVDAIEARTKTPGGMWPNDGARRLAAGSLASGLAQNGGSGVPSESELRLADEATTPGPRQQAALDEARRQFRGGIAGASKSVGAGSK